MLKKVTLRPNGTRLLLDLLILPVSHNLTLELCQKSLFTHSSYLSKENPRRLSKKIYNWPRLEKWWFKISLPKKIPSNSNVCFTHDENKVSVGGTWYFNTFECSTTFLSKCSHSPNFLFHTPILVGSAKDRRFSAEEEQKV